MAADINDKFSKVSTGIRPKTTAVAGVRAPSGTTLTCDDLTGWTTDTAVHFVTYKADAQGKVVAGSQTDFKGIVSGNSIINLTVTGGNDNGNAVGDIVQALPTAAWAKDLTDGLLVSHNHDGSLKDGIVTADALGDSGWLSATMTSPYTGAIDCRKIGRVVYLRGYAQTSSSFSTDWSDVATLPVGFRPPVYTEGTAAKNHQIRVSQNGVISIARGAGVAQPLIYIGYVSYVV